MQTNPPNTPLPEWQENSENFLKRIADFPKDAPETWQNELNRILYEPVHSEGGVCWCGVSYEKRDDGMHIVHKEQRDNIKDFISSLLSHQLDQILGEVEKAKQNIPPYPMEGPNAEMITWAAKHGHFNALSDLSSSLRSRYQSKDKENG